MVSSSKVQEAGRTPLSKGTVTEAGLALADAEGLDALTIRRLAQQLGVTPMALYWHFRSKEELLAGLGDRIWAEIDTDIDPSADWADQLRGMLESLIRVLREHPSGSQLLLLGEKLSSEAAQRATEVALDVLDRGGFDPVHASQIARSTLWTGLMLAMSEPGFSQASMTDDERAELQRRHQVELAMLPPDRFPRLAAAAGPMTACRPEDVEFHYRYGIDLFVAGVRAMAPGSRAAR